MDRHVYRVLSDTRFWLAALCAACACIYVRGLGGDFLFDDFPNIVTNPALQSIQNGDKPDWFAVMLLTGSGLLRRPISMLSFGLNVYGFGMDPFAFKLVNLAIHLLNGVLLYAIFHRIANRVLPQDGAFRPEVLATIAIGAWLLHPLQVSSVLYIVQRMNLLATMFTLMGLLCYAEGRLRMLRGEPGLLVGIAGLCVFGLLAVFSKENGALIAMYAFAIECLAFRFAASAGKRRILLAFFGLSVALPLVLYAAYVAMHPESLAYARNGFTLYTRLLSEARVLCDYLVWIFVPMPSFMGMYHDDIAVSASLFSPITTALSIAFLAALCASAWLLRTRLPVFAFGVAWFFIGHSLESTIFPLELVFEHRNYLPMAGPLLTAVCLLASARAPFWPSRKGLAAFAAFAIVLLGGITAVRADSWGSALSLALADVAHHPLSSRSQYEAGRAIAAAAARDGTLKTATPAAIAYLKRAAELDPRQVFPGVSMILLRGTAGPVPPEEVADLAVRLRNAASNEQANPFLQLLVAASDSQLALTPSDVATLFDAALANPRWRPQVRAMMFNDYGAYIFNVVHDHQEAVRLTTKAAATDPTNAYFELNLAKIALATGDRMTATDHLKAAQRLDKIGLHDKDIDELKRQIGN